MKESKNISKINPTTSNQPQQAKAAKLPIDGVLLIDKPLGLSSNQILQRVKRLFNAKKAGHTGALDPLASGMLPICFGKATKFAQYLLDADKHYTAEATLGIMTDSGDMDGEVIQRRPVGKISDDALAMVLDKFKGDIQQVPPMHSALKHKGQPLYKLARKGIKVDRPPRDVKIFQLDLLDRTENTLLIDVICSKGTYIRTLVQDIGKALLCGATVSMLRRVNVGTFKNYPMFTLDYLEQVQAEQGQAGLEKLLLPISVAIAGLPELTISETEWLYLKNGRSFKPVPSQAPGFVKLKLYTGQMLGVGDVDEKGMLNTNQLIHRR